MLSDLKISLARSRGDAVDSLSCADEYGWLCGDTIGIFRTCDELWNPNNGRYKYDHIEFNDDLDDEERVLCWNVYPGFLGRAHYNLKTLFFSFLIFLPITELIILVVSTARKPLPDADQWPMPTCLATVQTVCAAAVGNLQKACAKAIDKFQEVTSSKEQRQSLAIIYRGCTYLPTMVLLVLAGSTWKGLYNCSFSGDDQDAALLGEALALMLFFFIAGLVIEKITASKTLTNPLTKRYPALHPMRQTLVLYAILICLGFFIFNLFVTIGKLCARRRAYIFHWVESVWPPGVKLSQSADLELKPIFMKIGFHFEASFDPQTPTMNVVVSAKFFQLIVSLLLAIVQVVCFGPAVLADAGPLTKEMRDKLATILTKEYDYLIGSADGTTEGERPTRV